MLDEYFKKIEHFITPTHYSRANYKDKIFPLQSSQAHQPTNAAQAVQTGNNELNQNDLHQINSIDN